MKPSAMHLAAFGGEPLFNIPLHVGQPIVASAADLLADFEQILLSGQLTNNGPRVRQFEQRIADVTGTKYCIATCNATIALQIVARAMNLTGQVIMPAFTFIATAHAMEWIGLQPVFADVDPHTHTLDPASAVQCINSATSAILPVHLWGHASQPEVFEDICHQHGLKLLFDASHAFGCAYKGRPVGGFGQAEVFSFHATKFVHAFEGGAIVTNDPELADRCRLLRAFGISGLTEISDVGTNGKMHELSAAAGLRSVAALPELSGTNQLNRQCYAASLGHIPGLDLVPVPEHMQTNGQYVVVCVDADQYGLSRDQLLGILRAEGVFARSYFAPGCHRATPYARPRTTEDTRDTESFPRTAELPVTEHLIETVLQLPTGRNISPQQIFAIGQLLKQIHDLAADIRRLWGLRRGGVFQHLHDPARDTVNVQPLFPLKDAG